MSFWRLFYHLVWPTKNRERLIQPIMEDRLHGYLIRTGAELDVYVYAINSWYDHVHLVVTIPPQHAIADVVQRLKDASAHHVNHSFDLGYTFAWQPGYGVLSVGERQRPIAEAYVRNHKQHHQEQTTNTWLERVDDADEGPYATDGAELQTPRHLSETLIPYRAWGEPPF